MTALRNAAASSRVRGKIMVFLMGLGAAFGALNTGCSSVSSRRFEIVAFGALVFGAAALVVSVLVEALVVCRVGGSIEGAFAHFVLDGFRTAAMNWKGFGPVSVSFIVILGLLVWGAVSATLMELVGAVSGLGGPHVWPSVLR